MQRYVLYVTDIVVKCFCLINYDVENVRYIDNAILSLFRGFLYFHVIMI